MTAYESETKKKPIEPILIIVAIVFLLLTALWVWFIKTGIAHAPETIPLGS